MFAYKGNENDFLEERNLANTGPQLSFLLTVQAVLREMHYVLLNFFFIEVRAIVNLYSLFLVIMFHLSNNHTDLLIGKPSFFGNQGNLVRILCLLFLLFVLLVVIIADIAELIEIVFGLGELDGLQMVVCDLRVRIADKGVSRRIVNNHMEDFVLKFLQGIQLVDCLFYFLIDLRIAYLSLLLANA